MSSYLDQSKEERYTNENAKFLIALRLLVATIYAIPLGQSEKDAYNM